MHWNPGAKIVNYEMWGRGIGTARPVTVVEDLSTHIALYSHPDARIMTRGIEDSRRIGLSGRTELMIQMLDPNLGEFREGNSSVNHVLTLTPPNSWHSVWLLWSSDWQFKTWYVNLQSPLRRVRQGVQLHDYVLDIVVRPDMSWAWKDMDEFEELIARRFFNDEQESSIRAEAVRMVRTIERFGKPFCDGWQNWRPDQGWPIPRLPHDYLDVDWKEPVQP